MRAFKFNTLTDLHDGLCEALIWAPRDQLDVVSTVDVQIHETMSYAKSMEWEFDLKSMWLTPSRWTMMVRQYIDPADLDFFIAQCVKHIGTGARGIAAMRTKIVKARGGAATGHTNKETRRWGSCMLGIGYKAMPRPTITLWSRTSYLGYIGALDLSVAWAIARQLGLELGLEPSDFAFVWYNSALQWHNFKSLAYMLNNPDEKKRKKYRKLILRKERKLNEVQRAELAASPALMLSRKWMQKVIKEDEDGVTYGDMTYNTYRRIRRRYHTEVHGLEYAKQFEGWSYWKMDRGEHEKGDQKEFFKAYLPLPHCPIGSKDLRAVGWPLDRRSGVEYDGEIPEEDDDDEE